MLYTALIITVSDYIMMPVTNLMDVFKMETPWIIYFKQEILIYVSIYFSKY